MDRTERFYRIRRRLIEKGMLTRREIEDDLEISHATFKRDIEYLRDRLGVPIVWSRGRQAYVLDKGAELTELPGVWFSPGEIYALLEIEHLLGNLGAGLLGRQLEPLRARLKALLERGDRGHREIRRRIRVLGLGTRRVDREIFEAVSLALLGRKRVSIRHLKRGDGGMTERIVSPQRLVHYRYNWYLDAWCHMRKDLRVFALDAIKGARVTAEAAREVADLDLDRVLGAGYGIFAGAETQTAVLRFTPESARWVADEVWHSRQVGRIEADGSYLLQLPYSKEPELVMDLLRHGAGVEVIAPPALRARVAAELSAAAGRYA
ncbi:MAG: helix-turn-helix transcriptional regulator [Steroidobacteraceae bacterium]